jgi:hypothetical protein
VPAEEPHAPNATHLPNCLSEYVSADFPPFDDQPVLAIRKSGYGCSSYELITARYMPEYRPHDPWRMIDGESVKASGHPVLGWKNAFRWLQAS